MSVSGQESGFRHLQREILRRTRGPVAHVTFWTYLVFGVAFFGGLGVWLELIAYVYAGDKGSTGALRTSLFTFFPALVGSTSLQLIFSDDSSKPIRAFAVSCFIIFLVAAIWLAMDREMPNARALVIAVPASVFAIWIWWLANADNPAFDDQVSPAAAVGGEPEEAVSGSLDGFKH